jgi:hypothetical protein
MNFNFGEVLSRAWQIIWKYKVLWIFGIFAGCSRGGNGGNIGGGNGPGGQPPIPDIERNVEQISQWIDTHLFIIAVLFILLLVLIVIGIFLGTIGRIGLIKGTYKAEQGVESMSFGELFSESMPYFWRVFGLSFLVGLLALVVVLGFVFLAVLFGVATMGIGMLCILPLICLLIPAFWAVGVVIEQANVAMVLDDLGIGDGVRRGWEVIRANIGTMILMALILFVGSLVAGFIIALPMMIAVLPFMSAATGTNASPIWIGVLCLAAYLPFLIVLNGIITAYVQTAWALTYMRVTRPPTNAPVLLEANA